MGKTSRLSSALGLEISFSSPLTLKGEIIVHDGTDDIALSPGDDYERLEYFSSASVGIVKAPANHFIVFTDGELETPLWLSSLDVNKISWDTVGDRSTSDITIFPGTGLGTPDMVIAKAGTYLINAYIEFGTNQVAGTGNGWSYRAQLNITKSSDSSVLLSSDKFWMWYSATIGDGLFDSKGCFIHGILTFSAAETIRIEFDGERMLGSGNPTSFFQSSTSRFEIIKLV